MAAGVHPPGAGPPGRHAPAAVPDDQRKHLKTREKATVPETPETQGAWLTQEAYDRLKKELDHISGPYRQEIVDRIEKL